jgi:hypothetical protein
VLSHDLPYSLVRTERSRGGRFWCEGSAFRSTGCPHVRTIISVGEQTCSRLRACLTPDEPPRGATALDRAMASHRARGAGSQIPRHSLPASPRPLPVLRFWQRLELPLLLQSVERAQREQQGSGELRLEL